jgi:hypothetical protein
MAVGSSDDAITLEPGVKNLAANVLVGNSNDHAILGGVVLVLGLYNQPLTGVVIGLAFPAPAELNLEPLEVGLVLDNLDKRLKANFKISLIRQKAFQALINGLSKI